MSVYDRLDPDLVVYLRAAKARGRGATFSAPALERNIRQPLPGFRLELLSVNREMGLANWRLSKGQLDKLLRLVDGGAP